MENIGLIPCSGSHFSSKAVVYGRCLVMLPLTINETLKWLTSLAILMQNQSGGDVALGIAPLSPMLLGSQSLPVPPHRQPGIKQL